MNTQVETHIKVQLSNRNRASVFWRGVLAVPFLIFIGSFQMVTSDIAWSAPVVVAPVFLALLFRQVYPSYLLNFNHAVTELSTRGSAYLFLLTDEYPSIERNPNIAVIFPDVAGGKGVDRYLPLVKWLLAIPLYIVGVIYIALSAVTTIFAWVITSITGTDPEWAANIVLGTIDFWNRVFGYAFLLVTDEYPSFAL
jgi:hypothetical protein